jgi:hypothetical protein
LLIGIISADFTGTLGTSVSLLEFVVGDLGERRCGGT